MKADFKNLQGFVSSTHSSVLLSLVCLLGCAPLPLANEAAAAPSDPDESKATGPQSSAQTEPARAAPSVQIEDDVVPEPQASEELGSESQAHPLDGVPDEEIRQRVKEDLASLGSMSLGRPNSGSLVNPVAMPEDARWVVVDASHSFGTDETIANLKRVIAHVDRHFENTAPLHVGHISGPNGGHLSPHLSHQTGRDVDLAYYYTNEGTWYQKATKENLDVARTWALVRAIITQTDVKFLLIDRRVQSLLQAHAEAIGEDPAWLADVFGGKKGKRMPLIRHVAGHATHFHVRFYNPIAEETARRCYPALIAEGKVKPPVYYLQHRAKKGDSLIRLAKRYGTTVRAIQRANGLRSTKIFAKKTYKIPKTGPAALSSQKGTIPPRRLPPRDPEPPQSAAESTGRNESSSLKRAVP